MAVFLLVAILFLILQILIGLYSLIIRSDLVKKFNYPLGSMVTPAEALEKYSKIIEHVSLRVNAEIELPAYAIDQIVLVNKSKVYQTDLFSNFFTLFQVQLSKRKNLLTRDFGILLNFLFFIEIFLILLSLFLFESEPLIFPIMSITTSLVLIFLSLVYFFSLETILKKTLDVSKDLLDLDKVEFARAEVLANQLRFEAFEYPVKFFRGLISFILP